MAAARRRARASWPLATRMTVAEAKTMTAAAAKVVRVPKCWSTTPPSADPPAMPVWVPPESQPNASTACGGGKFPGQVVHGPKRRDEPEPGYEHQWVENGDIGGSDHDQ